jgi:hypothetical protein
VPVNIPIASYSLSELEKELSVKTGAASNENG